MKKIIVVFMLVLLLAFSVFALTNEVDATLELKEMVIDPVSATVEFDEEFTVTVKAKIDISPDALAVWAKVTYDATQLEVSAAEMSAALSGWVLGSGVDISTPGEVTLRKQYVGTSSSGVSGEFDIGTITFKVITNSPGTIDVSLSDDDTYVDAGSGDIILTRTGATFTIPSDEDSASPVPAPADGCGDLTDDGLIKKNDIVLLNNLISSARTPPPKIFRKADVDGNGRLGNKDVKLLQAYKNGAVKKLLCVSGSEPTAPKLFAVYVEEGASFSSIGEDCTVGEVMAESTCKCVEPMVVIAGACHNAALTPFMDVILDIYMSDGPLLSKLAQLAGAIKEHLSLFE